MPLQHSAANVSGSDVEAVRQLAQVLQQSSDQIRQAGEQVNAQMQQTEWNGQDASQYEQEWDGNIFTQLQRIADQLVEHGQTAERNASEQEGTSNAL
ncbi:WXG100 family type VII secretion target [Myceligenerans pegani]|uniref:WXG100 family type VII secretion target n=1 Tax=Myceligenerans pegani TaxID=2776917 RepID=A0ABR9N6V8_9MICO|nr:WXG100 family type VII secretion target [Myceligenerans sp. TRM 65318]MBE1878873.1 WXG100 family type VII secretion target [Myceligenerans sp. TRM 65318]MBE3021144.1 WXG100 family type VII secretion target [Myceligenerans sp. TRM 65318]